MGQEINPHARTRASLDQASDNNEKILMEAKTSFPHVFLLGAQKSGTSALAAAMDKLDGVSVSKPKEPMLLSRDEVELHAHFFANTPQAWEAWNVDGQPQLLFEAYQKAFAHAREGDLLVDASTSYLPSIRAPQRIKRHRPDAKFIIILRNPADRAHANWWHHIRNGISGEDFAGHLQFEHSMTIRNGEYEGHIRRWLEVFPREQFLFLLYEEMAENQQATMDNLCNFLEIPRQETIIPTRNEASSLRSFTLQLWANRLRRRLRANHSAIHKQNSLTAKLLDKLNIWNRKGDSPRPKMDAALRRRLNIHYRRANAELDALTELDIKNRWYKDE